MLASALQLLGIAVFVLAVWLFIPLLGLAATGAALLAVGYFLED